MAEVSRIEVDEAGARRWLMDGSLESVSWARLTLVAILTTDDGPFSEDQFWVLEDGEGGACVLPMGEVPGAGLLERFQRLPGFDNDAVIDASSSVKRAVYTCWQKN